ncbi:protocadherin Fat 3-like [Haliotis rufescens]|uniref:protocadherin Fat 3-like n=1 Tax=Haliotis rufescens TaxID=6454 RepID=UPI00201E8771|nr:protocadherin Fat 3-like [Haliotis rufescens]
MKGRWENTRMRLTHIPGGMLNTQGLPCVPRPYKVEMSLLVLQLMGITMSNAGRYVYQTTSSDNMNYFLNDLGVKVTGNSPLIFEVKTCQDAIIRLAETKDLVGNYYDVVLGAGSNTWSGLRDRCSGCGANPIHFESILDCASYKELWVAWNGNGNVTVGTGSDVSKNVILTLSDPVPFEIHYITVSSYYGVTGEWKIVVDESPVISNPSQDGVTLVSVSEGTPQGEVILNIQVSDPEGDKLTLTLFNDDTGQFEIDHTELKIHKKLDFEKASFHHLILSVSDGHNEVNVSLTVDVIDECDEVPNIHLSDVMTIQEELLEGSVIGQMYTVTDKDKNDAYTFNLTGSDSSYFNINATSGQLTSRGRVDRDGVGGRQYLDQLLLWVQDSCGQSVAVNLNITVLDINDNPPHFSEAVYYANITENGTSEYIVAILTVTDADSGSNGNVTLTLIEGDDSSNPVFTLDGGVLSGRSQRADYEAGPSGHRYLLTIQATDTPDTDQPLSSTCVVVVEIVPDNEHTPSWVYPLPGETVATVEISESVGMGMSILTLAATDEDLGADGTLTFSVVSLTLANGSISPPFFTLDSTSGLLQTALLLDCDPDTGGTEYFDLVVMVTDNGVPSKSSEKTIRLLVDDVNDNPPETDVREDVVVDCDKDVGDIITSINVTDADVSKGEYSFGIIYSDIDSVSVNETSGSLILQSKSINDENRNVSIVIKVTDGTFSVTVIKVLHLRNCSLGHNESTDSTPPAETIQQTTTTSTTVTPSSQSQPRQGGSDNDGVVEVWSLRAACGVLGITLAGTVTTIIIRHMLSTSTKSKNDFTENRVSPTSTSTSSQLDGRTEITTYTSVESLASNELPPFTCRPEAVLMYSSLVPE